MHDTWFREYFKGASRQKAQRWGAMAWTVVAILKEGTGRMRNECAKGLTS